MLLWDPRNFLMIIYLFQSESDEAGSCSGANRMKAVSPGNMNLPLPPVGSWDSGMVMSPFGPPDMNSKFRCRNVECYLSSSAVY